MDRQEDGERKAAVMGGIGAVAGWAEKLNRP